MGASARKLVRISLVFLLEEGNSQTKQTKQNKGETVDNSAGISSIVVHPHTNGEDLLTEEEYRQVAFEAHQSKIEAKKKKIHLMLFSNKQTKANKQWFHIFSIDPWLQGVVLPLYP